MSSAEADRSPGGRRRRALRIPANLLGRPRLRTAEEAGEERHASWLELFFDLVFVLAIAELAHNLSGDLTPTGFVLFAALSVPVWWAWAGYTFYADRFETDDAFYRLAMFAAMLAIAALALSVHDAFHGGSAAFAAAYVLVRVVLIGLYARARRHVPAARELCGRYIVGFGVGASLWLASLLVPEPIRYGFWAAGLAVELATPLLSSRAIARTPYDTSHVPERFGLFTIIVLGECVLLVATGVSETSWRAASVFTAAIGFAMVASLWWVYFDFTETSAIRERRPWAGQVYVYGHLLIVLGLTSVAVGIEHAILEVGEGPLGAGARWALCGGIVLFLLSTTAIHVAARRAANVLVPLGLAATATGLALAGGGLSPPILEGLLLLLLVGKVILGTILGGDSTVPATEESEPTGAA